MGNPLKRKNRKKTERKNRTTQGHSMKGETNISQEKFKKKTGGSCFEKFFEKTNLLNTNEVNNAACIQR